MPKSVSEYLLSVWRYWWAIVPLALFGLIGSVADVSDSIEKQSVIPLWLWVFIAFSGMAIAQFLAWRDMRNARNALQEQLDGLLDQPLLWLATTEPNVNIKERWFQLHLHLENMSSVPVRFKVERVHLQIGGRTAPFSTVAPGGIVYPGRVAVFGSQVVHDIDYSKGPLLGEIEINFTYYPVPRLREYELKDKQSFTISASAVEGERDAIMLNFTAQRIDQ